MEALPVVALVGRINVGKSSLLNAMAGRRISIVDAAPGVTRDRVTAVVRSGATAFEVVDTAGVGLDRGQSLSEAVERQIRYAIESADLVLFVVDAIAGSVPEDLEIARKLRRSGKPVLLIANKADTPRHEEGLAQFAELGFGDAVPVSSAHRRLVGELVELVAGRLPGVAPAASAPLKIAVVGKRNVGKSTLINALAGEERVVVSELPGTTRDAVDVLIRKGKREFLLIDTAGLRKKGKLEDSVELFSRVRTQEAIDRADAVLFLIDATERITEVDKRIGELIEKRKKPAVLVLNKWDQVPPGAGPGDYEEYLDRAMPLLRYAPVMMISALKGERIWEIFKVAGDLHHQASQRISTPEINRVLDRAEAERSPGTRGTREPKIYYGTQTRANPPTFAIFVNDPANFTPDYVRFLENKFRQHLPFKEVPLRLRLRRRVTKTSRSYS
ncbi:MAG: ribosome biogenesis GTPase Der [Planctomycetes bacterium]|nr:ribosome biogenesis GTPase Der [Planctomycetota bacterium]